MDELSEISEMRTGGFIPKKGEAEPCKVEPSTLPGNAGLQMVHLMEWSPDVLREMVIARPGATGSVGSRGSLLPPLKTWIPVSLACSPSLPALFLACHLASKSQVVLLVFLPPLDFSRLEVQLQDAGGPVSGGRKGLHFAFSKLLET